MQWYRTTPTLPNPNYLRTTQWMNAQSSLTNPPFSNWERLTNVGKPDAVFISNLGLWNELLMGSGRKVVVVSCPPVWLISLNIVNGHGRILSNSPSASITTKNRDMCVFFPIPSPFKYICSKTHFVSMSGCENGAEKRDKTLPVYVCASLLSLLISGIFQAIITGSLKHLYNVCVNSNLPNWQKRLQLCFVSFLFVLEPCPVLLACYRRHHAPCTNPK